MLDNHQDVVRSLITYTDWWQPTTTSLMQVRGGRHESDGLREGLFDTFEERSELRRRVWLLDERDRQILFLWYVRQLTAAQIAATIGVSRRHVARLRGAAVKALVDLGRPHTAA